MEDKKKILFGVATIAILLGSSKKKNSNLVVNNIVESLEKHPTKVYPTRDLSDIKEIVLHHYASNGTPQAIAHHHVKCTGSGRCWAGIGYHYTIDKDGTVSQVNYHKTYSNHTYNHNYKSIGVALEGNFKIENPTIAQMNSLNALIPHIRKQFSQPLEVFQHSDFANKPYDASLNLAPYKLASINSIYKGGSGDHSNHIECQNGSYTDSFNPGRCSHNGGLYDELKNISDQDLETYFYKDYYVAELLAANKVSRSDFIRYGDSNLLKEQRNWISKKAMPLDVAAQSLSFEIGIEVTPEDLIEVVLSYPSAKAFKEELKYLVLDLQKRQAGIGSIYPNNKCPEFFMCSDGTFTTIKGKGACSHHGGVLVEGKKTKKRRKKDEKTPIAPPIAKENQPKYKMGDLVLFIGGDPKDNIINYWEVGFVNRYANNKWKGHYRLQKWNKGVQEQKQNVYEDQLLRILPKDLKAAKVYYNYEKNYVEKKKHEVPEPGNDTYITNQPITRKANKVFNTDKKPYQISSKYNWSKIIWWLPTVKGSIPLQKMLELKAAEKEGYVLHHADTKTSAEVYYLARKNEINILTPIGATFFAGAYHLIDGEIHKKEFCELTQQEFIQYLYATPKNVSYKNTHYQYGTSHCMVQVNKQSGFQGFRLCVFGKDGLPSYDFKYKENYPTLYEALKAAYWVYSTVNECELEKDKKQVKKSVLVPETKKLLRYGTYKVMEPYFVVDKEYVFFNKDIDYNSEYERSGDSLIQYNVSSNRKNIKGINYFGNGTAKDAIELIKDIEKVSKKPGMSTLKDPAGQFLDIVFDYAKKENLKGNARVIYDDLTSGYGSDNQFKSDLTNKFFSKEKYINDTDYYLSQMPKIKHLISKSKIIEWYYTNLFLAMRNLKDNRAFQLNFVQLIGSYVNDIKYSDAIKYFENNSIIKVKPGKKINASILEKSPKPKVSSKSEKPTKKPDIVLIDPSINVFSNVWKLFVKSYNKEWDNAAQLKEGFKAAYDLKDHLMAELMKKKKPKLLKLLYNIDINSYFRHKNDRKEIIAKDIIHSIAIGFLDNSTMRQISMSSNYYKEPFEYAKERINKEWTDERYLEEKQKKKDRLAAKNKAIDNPETLEELRIAKKKRDLTNDEQQKLSQLEENELLRLAERARETVEKEREAKRAKMAAAKSVDADVNFLIEDFVHTKTGEKFKVAIPSNRVSKEEFKDLNNRSYRLGGQRFSRYAKGWIFKTLEQAEKFSNITKEVEQQEKEIEKDNWTKFRDAANNIESKADDVLTADRKVNTGRRMRMAKGVMSDAEGRKWFAGLLRAIADMQENKETKFLTWLQYQTEIESLLSLERQARWEFIRKNERKDLTYDAYRELVFNEPFDIRFKDYLKSGVCLPAHVWSRFADDAIKTKGAMQFGKRLKKYVIPVERRHIDDRNFCLPSYEMDNLGNAIRKVIKDAYSHSYLKESYTIARRLEKLGLSKPNLLFAAIKELNQAKERASGLTSKTKSNIDFELQELRQDKWARKELDYFPTNDRIAKEMAEFADIAPGSRVLEPSAGDGALLKAVKEVQPGAILEAVEIQSKLQEYLKKSGFNVVASDFETFNPAYKYDAIVMNPPFSNRKDAIQVLKAYSLLKPGGKLVAIVSEGAMFASDKNSKALQNLFSTAGTYERKLIGEFKEMGTGVNTRLIVLDGGESINGIFGTEQKKEPNKLLTALFLGGLSYLAIKSKTKSNGKR